MSNKTDLSTENDLYYGTGQEEVESKSDTK